MISLIDHQHLLNISNKCQVVIPNLDGGAKRGFTNRWATQTLRADPGAAPLKHNKGIKASEER